MAVIRLIPLGESFKNKTGLVLDKKSTIDTGIERRSQRIGLISVNKNGVGRYFPPRESTFAFVFKGIPDVITDNYGDYSNAEIIEDFLIPIAPTLHEVEEKDVTSHTDYELVRLYWHLEQNIACFYKIEIKMIPSETDDPELPIFQWISEKDQVEIATYPLQLSKSFQEYQIRVAGTNKNNEMGEYSNIISYTTGEILRDGGSASDKMPPFKEKEYSWELVDNE